LKAGFGSEGYPGAPAEPTTWCEGVYQSARMAWASCVAGLQRGLLLADVKGAFQFGAADRAFAANEAGGVVTGRLHDLVVAERRGYVGGGVGGGGNGADDRVSGHNEAGGIGSTGQASSTAAPSR
jgi:hypothetical protein